MTIDPLDFRNDLFAHSLGLERAGKLFYCLHLARKKGLDVIFLGSAPEPYMGKVMKGRKVVGRFADLADLRAICSVYKEKSTLKNAFTPLTLGSI